MTDLELAEKWTILAVSNPVSALAVALQYEGFVTDVLSTALQGQDKETYLLRYCLRDSEDEPRVMLLMGDLGITWEPARAYPTEELGRISVEMSLDEVVKELIDASKRE